MGKSATTDIVAAISTILDQLDSTPPTVPEAGPILQSILIHLPLTNDKKKITTDPNLVNLFKDREFISNLVLYLDSSISNNVVQAFGVFNTLFTRHYINFPIACKYFLPVLLRIIATYKTSNNNNNILDTAKFLSSVLSMVTLLLKTGPRLDETKQQFLYKLLTNTTSMQLYELITLNYLSTLLESYKTVHDASLLTIVESRNTDDTTCITLDELSKLQDIHIQLNNILLRQWLEYLALFITFIQPDDNIMSQITLYYKTLHEYIVYCNISKDIVIIYIQSLILILSASSYEYTYNNTCMNICNNNWLMNILVHFISSSSSSSDYDMYNIIMSLFRRVLTADDNPPPLPIELVKSIFQSGFIYYLLCRPTPVHFTKKSIFDTTAPAPATTTTTSPSDEYKQRPILPIMTYQSSRDASSTIWMITALFARIENEGDFDTNIDDDDDTDMMITKSSSKHNKITKKNSRIKEETAKENNRIERSKRRLNMYNLYNKNKNNNINNIVPLFNTFSTILPIYSEVPENQDNDDNDHENKNKNDDETRQCEITNIMNDTDSTSQTTAIVESSTDVTETSTAIEAFKYPALPFPLDPDDIHYDLGHLLIVYYDLYGFIYDMVLQYGKDDQLLIQLSWDLLTHTMIECVSFDKLSKLIRVYIENDLIKQSSEQHIYYSNIINEVNEKNNLIMESNIILEKDNITIDHDNTIAKNENDIIILKNNEITLENNRRKAEALVKAAENKKNKMDISSNSKHNDTDKTPEQDTTPITEEEAKMVDGDDDNNDIVDESDKVDNNTSTIITSTSTTTTTTDDSTPIAEEEDIELVPLLPLNPLKLRHPLTPLHPVPKPHITISINNNTITFYKKPKPTDFTKLKLKETDIIPYDILSSSYYNVIFILTQYTNFKEYEKYSLKYLLSGQQGNFMSFISRYTRHCSLVLRNSPLYFAYYTHNSFKCILYGLVSNIHEYPITPAKNKKGADAKDKKTVDTKDKKDSITDKTDDVSLLEDKNTKLDKDNGMNDSSSTGTTAPSAVVSKDDIQVPTVVTLTANDASQIYHTSLTALLSMYQGKYKQLWFYNHFDELIDDRDVPLLNKQFIYEYMNSIKQYNIESNDTLDNIPVPKIIEKNKTAGLIGHNKDTNTTTMNDNDDNITNTADLISEALDDLKNGKNNTNDDDVNTSDLIAAALDDLDSDSDDDTPTSKNQQVTEETHRRQQQRPTTIGQYLQQHREKMASYGYYRQPDRFGRRQGPPPRRVQPPGDTRRPSELPSASLSPTPDPSEKQQQVYHSKYPDDPYHGVPIDIIKSAEDLFNAIPKDKSQWQDFAKALDENDQWLFNFAITRHKWVDNMRQEYQKSIEKGKQTTSTDTDDSILSKKSTVPLPTDGTTSRPKVPTGKTSFERDVEREEYELREVYQRYSTVTLQSLLPSFQDMFPDRLLSLKTRLEEAVDYTPPFPFLVKKDRIIARFVLPHLYTFLDKVEEQIYQTQRVNTTGKKQAKLYQLDDDDNNTSKKVPGPRKIATAAKPTAGAAKKPSAKQATTTIERNTKLPMGKPIVYPSMDDDKDILDDNKTTPTSTPPSTTTQKQPQTKKKTNNTKK